MILNLCNIISEDSETNNKLVTSKTIKMTSICFIYRHGRKGKKYYYLQIFNTLKRLQINVGEDVWKR